MERDLALDPPGEGRWIARPRKPRWVLPVIALSPLTFQLPNLFRMIAKHFVGEDRSWLVYLVVLPVVLIPLAIWLFREWRARRMTPRDATLLDDAFGDQFAAELTVFAAATPLGSDRGVVWFADGLLGFSGDATSFVLAASDLRPGGSPGGRRRRPRSTNLNLTRTSLEASIALVPLAGFGAAFRARLDAFFAADERPVGDRFFPPLTPYAEGTLSKREKPRDALD